MRMSDWSSGRVRFRSIRSRTILKTSGLSCPWRLMVSSMDVLGSPRMSLIASDSVIPLVGLPLIAVIRSPAKIPARSEEHTSELPSLMRISYAVLCLQKQTIRQLPAPRYHRHPRPEHKARVTPTCHPPDHLPHNTATLRPY